jgi:hypothetical protein
MLLQTGERFFAAHGCVLGYPEEPPQIQQPLEPGSHVPDLDAAHRGLHDQHGRQAARQRDR